MISKRETQPVLRTVFAKIFALSLEDFFFLCFVCMSLLIARGVFFFQPANTLIAKLRKIDDGNTPQSGKERDYVSRLSKLMAMAVAKLPWRTDCLIQCLAAKWLLRRKNIPSHFFLAIDKVSKVEISAHAWLKIGNVSIPADRNEHMNVVTQTLPSKRLQ